MENQIELLTVLLYVAMAVLMVLVLVFIFVYFSMNKTKKKSAKVSSKTTQKKQGGTASTEQSLSKLSVLDFMEFDGIDDNMITEKNGKKYAMAIECQGINYDLMSSVEKNSVESGFIQFLNTLRFPIQLYIQTRTVDLEKSIEGYKNKVAEIERDLEKVEMEYNRMKNSGRYTSNQLNKAFYEVTRRRNLYEYGKDVIRNTQSMSLNNNVLKKKYYIIISYFSEEANNENLDKSEIKEIAFSELYTRAQALIRTISVCGVIGKTLDSYGLAELLYNAYNRDEAESFGLEKAIKAGYDELYTTAPDVIERKMKVLDKKIEDKALDMVANEVEKVRYAKQKEYENMKNNEDDLIYELAQALLEDNASYIGEDVAKEAKQNIKAKKERSKKVKEGGEKVEQEEKKVRRRTTTKSDKK